MLSAATTIAPLAAPRICQAAAPPVNIIFDTEMGGDCDDVGALFILHGAVERGEAKLLATMGCVSADAIAPRLDSASLKKRCLRVTCCLTIIRGRP